MFIKYEWKIYKQVELEELSRDDLLEVVKWVRVVPKEITIREPYQQIMSPRIVPPNIVDNIRYKEIYPNDVTCWTLTTTNTEKCTKPYKRK